MRQQIMIAVLVLGSSVLPVYAQEEDQEKTQQQEESTPKKPTPEQKQLQENQKAIATKEEEIAQLQKKIEQLQTQRDSVKAQSQTAQLELERIDQNLAKARLELRQTQLTITDTQQRVAQTEAELADSEEALTDMREQLGSMVRLLYENEQRSALHIFLSSGSFAEVVTERNIYREIQERILNLINEVRERQEELQGQQTQLESRQQQLANLEQALVTQRQELAQDQEEKNNVVQQKKSEQAHYEQQIAEAQQARDEIKNDVFRLKNTGVEVSFSDAHEAARFASSVTGVRAALLLAVLKVESNVGEWVGSGTFPDDMHPASRDSFIRLMNKLGRDPAAAPISRRPRSYAGWGGAMGPAQIMPQTWEGIEGHIAQLMNKTLPDPYELPDALVATGILLAQRGAADPAKEYEAVNRYLAGPNWIYHTWYGDRVLAVAKEYAKEGL